jgi:hypothetical protein
MPLSEHIDRSRKIRAHLLIDPRPCAFSRRLVSMAPREETELLHEVVEEIMRYCIRSTGSESFQKAPAAAIKA